MTEAVYNFREEQRPTLNIRRFLLQYLKNWYWFILSISLALGGAYLYLRYATPSYLISATMLIKDKPKSASDRILQEEQFIGGAVTVENEVELLKSRSLMVQVVDELNLTVRYYEQGHIGRDIEMYGLSPIRLYTSSLTPNAYLAPVFVKILNPQQYELQDIDGNSKGRYNFDQNAKSEYGSFRVFLKDSTYQKNGGLVKVSFHNREQIAQYYQAKLKIASASLQSSILKIFFDDAVPDRGRAIINKLLEVHTTISLADKNLEAKNELQFITDRLRLITGELGSVEHNFEDYRNTHGVTDLAQQGNIILGAANSTANNLNQAEVNLKILDGIDSYMKNSQSGVAPSLSSLPDPILREHLTKLIALQGEHEKLSRTMQKDNPFLQGITTQIESTKAAIQENVANQRQNLQLNLDNLRQTNKQADLSMRAIPRKEREFITIKRQQSIKESLYLLLLQKKEEAAIAYASAVTDSRIIDEASSGGFPLTPNPTNTYIVAFLVGLLIPIGGITAKTQLSGKVKSRSEIENETGLTVFGEIMKNPRSQKGNFTGIDTNKIITEQFNVLRANLPMIDGNQPPPGSQLILVTSSISGEGKSFFSINLAFSLAQLGKRVVILESDLRKPKTTSYMGMSNEGMPGLAEYLSGDSDVSELIRTTGHENLFLISSGFIPSHPSELLSNGRMGVLLNTLRQQFDYIILDTPPVTFLADTTILAPYADKVFYIVRNDYTPRNCIQLLTNMTTKHKFKSLNVIFNGVEYEKNQAFEYGYR
ncbi:tyrosine-protein kinase [Larkinella ripae]